MEPATSSFLAPLSLKSKTGYECWLASSINSWSFASWWTSQSILQILHARASLLAQASRGLPFSTTFFFGYATNLMFTGLVIWLNTGERAMQSVTKLSQGPELKLCTENYVRNFDYDSHR
jgi:hypothetical protein